MKKVFVGLSGGVDSSVSAALLQEQGFDVTGVFIKVWQPDFITCTATEDRLDAMRVCAKLNIPFITLDLEEEYKLGVVEYMIEEYKAGQTPNPDVMCNKQVKFGAFFNKAREMGADYIATGHYARVQNKVDSNSLLTGIDKNKDQSYFLWTLTQDHLAHTLFPIGEYEKKYVRELAEKYDLPTSQKKDSQGLCFIGKLDMKDFLKRYIPERPGEVLNTHGEVIGEHTGAVYFTLGQRTGFTIIKKTPNDQPYYVTSKDVEANTITVSDKPLEISERKNTFVSLKNTNWIATVPILGEKLTARLRYRQPLFACTVTTLDGEKGTAEVVLDEPQPFMPSGQSFVLYKDDECLGGGVIA